ncbi:MAG: putative O-glycosylation ligase, exosortase A system-associated [Neomegalonema sp.]|nr:putative O-glycosylation ligase, exosortase A system-associated [Neomegalonema sp.]
MRDLIVFIGMMTLIPLSGIRPVLSVYLWMWFGLMNPHRNAYGFAVDLPYNKMIAAITMISLVASPERKRLPGGALQWALFAFFAWTTLVTFQFATYQSYSAEVYTSKLLPVIIFLVCALLAINNKLKLHALVWVFCLSLGWHAAKTAIVVIAKGGDVGSFLGFGPADSMIEDRNHFALAMIMTIPLCLYLYNNSAMRLARLGAIAIALCCLIAIFGSFSRGGLVGLVVTAGYLWLYTKNKIQSGLIMGALGIVALIFMPDNFKERMSSIVEQVRPTEAWQVKEYDLSFEQRMAVWCMARDVAHQHPLTGGGLRIVQHQNTPQEYGTDACPLYNTIHWIPRAAHSIYFEVLSDSGWPGLALFLLIPIIVWTTTLQIQRRARGKAELWWAWDMARMLRAATIPYFVSGAALSMAYFDGYYAIVVMVICLRAVVGYEMSDERPMRRIRSGGWLNRSPVELEEAILPPGRSIGNAGPRRRYDKGRS